jgi:serine/threonine-protein kinase HipA
MKADMSTSVENEWLCSLLLEQYGVPVAKTRIAQFEDQKALVVERFDRRWSGDQQWIIRLPQEDMCQALAVSPLRKYQADGGPGISDIMGVLSHSDRAEHGQNTVLQGSDSFWLIILLRSMMFYRDIAGIHLTPLYDVLSAWPIIGNGKHSSWQKCKLAIIRGSSNYTRFTEY